MGEQTERRLKGRGTTAIANNLDRWGDSKALDLDGTEFTLRAASIEEITAFRSPELFPLFGLPEQLPT